MTEPAAVYLARAGLAPPLPTYEQAMQQAQLDIHEARGNHMNWYLFQDLNPEWHTTNPISAKVAGDQEWHKEWVDKYTNVLDVLRQADGPSALLWVGMIIGFVLASFWAGLLWMIL